MKKFFTEYSLSKKNLVKNYIWRLLQFASKQGINFFILMISASFLNKEDFGVYNYVIAIVFLLTLLADFGISKAVMRFVAEYNSYSNNKAKLVFFNSAIIILASIIIFSIVFVLFSQELVGEKHIYVKYLFPIFFLIPFSSLFEGIYIGLKQFKKLSIISISCGFISIIATIILVSRYQILGSFYSLNFYYFILFGSLVFSSKDFVFKYSADIFKEVGRYSFIIGFSDLGQFLYAKANVIILGKFGYFVEAGYYEIVDKIFILSVLPFLVFSQIIAPNIAEKSALGQKDQIISLFERTFKYSLLIGIAIAVSLWLFCPFLIELLLPKYSTENFYSIFNLMLLLLPLTIVSTSLAQPFIVATGNARFSLLTIPFGLLNVTLAVIFTGNFGFIGVVYATLIGSSTNKIVTYTAFYKKLISQ